MPPMSEKTLPTIVLDLVEQIARLDSKADLLLVDRGEASARRKEIYGRLEDVDRGVVEIRNALANLRRDVEKLEPIVAGLEQTAQRAQGIVWFLRFVWSTCGGIVGALVTWWLTHQARPPGH